MGGGGRRDCAVDGRHGGRLRCFGGLNILSSGVRESLDGEKGGGSCLVIGEDEEDSCWRWTRTC